MLNRRHFLSLPILAALPVALTAGDPRPDSALDAAQKLVRNALDAEIGRAINTGRRLAHGDRSGYRAGHLSEVKDALYVVAAAAMDEEEERAR